MIVLGLTGSIGMGKSTVASMLRRLGCPVHDSDVSVRELTAPDGAAFEEIAVTFPEAWDKKRHIIKRNTLADIVFSNESKREELESILHPLVQIDQQEFLHREAIMGREFAALDIPLLFETGAEKRVDYTITVTAPAHVQRRRVLSRPGIDESRLEAILKAQLPDATKRRLADFVVHTGLSYAHTFQEVKNILQKIRHENSQRFARSL